MSRTKESTPKPKAPQTGKAVPGRAADVSGKRSTAGCASSAKGEKLPKPAATQ